MPKQLAADQASKWQVRIAEQQRSGEPMAQFCRRKGQAKVARNILGLKGNAPTKNSIPNIPFIEVNAVAFQELPVFFLKPLVAVVLTLIGNVFADGIHIRFRKCKGTVAGLPRKPRE